MRILISQRIEEHVAYHERRDALDQRWPRTIRQLLGRDVTLLPIPNDPELHTSDLLGLRPALIILSGGNDIGSEPQRDEIERALLSASISSGTPILGVCRGLQMIQHYCGGELRAIANHVATIHSITPSSASEDPKQMLVNSYHSYAIRHAELARPLRPLLFGGGTVEALVHKDVPWLGIMWHPERPGNSAAAQEWLAAQLRGML